MPQSPLRNRPYIDNYHRLVFGIAFYVAPSQIASAVVTPRGGFHRPPLPLGACNDPDTRGASALEFASASAPAVLLGEMRLRFHTAALRLRWFPLGVFGPIFRGFTGRLSPSDVPALRPLPLRL